MTSTTERYRAATSQSASTVEKMADFWTQGSKKLTDYMPAGLPQVDLVPFVERYFEFVQRTVDISRDLTIKWAESAGMLSGVGREQAESVSGLVREQAESARDFAHEQAGKVEQSARQQAEQAEQAETERVRETRKAEREQAKHAHDRARERYEGLTKAELSDLLDKRDLPKTGNVDELVERLVKADSKYSRCPLHHTETPVPGSICRVPASSHGHAYGARAPATSSMALASNRCPACEGWMLQVPSGSLISSPAAQGEPRKAADGPSKAAKPSATFPPNFSVTDAIAELSASVRATWAGSL